jgi:hypothetical protein
MELKLVDAQSSTMHEQQRARIALHYLRKTTTDSRDSSHMWIADVPIPHKSLFVQSLERVQKPIHF